MKAIIFPQDPTEGDLLRQSLVYGGINVESYANMEATLANWSKHAGDLIILAIDGKISPIKQIQRVREVSMAPLFIIADQPTESELCEMLQTGADLVLSRPVGPRLLIAYARVLLRRADTVPQATLNAFTFDQFSLDPATRTVTVAGGEPQRLTRLEFRLLYVLIANREQVIPTELLIERVWGYENQSGDPELLRGLVSRTRKKLEQSSPGHRFIENIPGVGYRFTLKGVSPG